MQSLSDRSHIESALPLNLANLMPINRAGQDRTGCQRAGASHNTVQNAELYLFYNLYSYKFCQQMVHITNIFNSECHVFITRIKKDCADPG